MRFKPEQKPVTQADLEWAASRGSDVEVHLTKKERAKLGKVLANMKPLQSTENFTSELVKINGHTYLVIDNELAIAVWKIKERYAASFNEFKREKKSR